MGVVFSLLGVIVIITKAKLSLLFNLNFNKGDIWMVAAMFFLGNLFSFAEKEET